MRGDAVITRVSSVHARSEIRRWRWADDNREAISANWQRRIADKPRMFNGRVLLLGDISVTPETCSSIYFEVDYADLVAWIDMGYPDASVGNGFAMGALRGSDGAFICGIMADHTVNAGRVYFAAGTPDRSDLRSDGTVDLAGSLTRELIRGNRSSRGRLHRLRRVDCRATLANRRDDADGHAQCPGGRRRGGDKGADCLADPS